MPYDDETATWLRWWFSDESASLDRYAVPPARRPTDGELGRLGAARATVEDARLLLSLERCDPVAPAARAMAAGEALLDAIEAYANAVLAITEPRH
jgi:hypothetical protein